MLTDEDKQWILDRLERYEERVVEQMRDMQTELLKVCLLAQEQTRSREGALEARIAAVEARAAIVEGRLADMEKLLLLKPPAA